MIPRHALTAAALPVALALAAAGCTYDIKITTGGGAPNVTTSVSFNSSSLKESEEVPAQKVEVGSAPRVVVDNRVGRVRFTAGGDGAVEVEAVKHAATREDLAEIKLAVEKSGDVVTVTWDNGGKPVVNRVLDINVKAPKGSTLKLHTGNGALSIEGFARGAEAETGVGSITVKGVAGDLTLHTGNGAVDVQGATGAVKAETGVGAITVHGTDGARTVHTGNGPIRIDGAVGAVAARSDVGRIEVKHARGDLTLNTGNGTIRVDDADGAVTAESGVGAVEVAGRLAGKSHLKTGNGRVAVALPADSRLSVDASTGNGAIKNEFGLPVDGFVTRRSQGTIGDGSGGRLRIETGVGGITLTKRGS